MASLLLRNISTLAGILPAGVTRLKGHQMSELNVLQNAYLLIENGLIQHFGPDDECPYDRADKTIDCSDQIVLPAFCDSHTHLVFAAWRENEFVDRIHGLTYEEIARRGGGILNSAAKLRLMSEDELFDAAKNRLAEVIASGTGSIEIKSGYGLTHESEIKMLRVIRRLKELNWIPVRSTFLGAHAVPGEFIKNREGYIQLIIDKMLPEIASAGLADYIDVFCDKGFYSTGETSRILEAGMKLGLKPKIHANELDHSGGIQVGVKHNAISVDHLEYTGAEELQALSSSTTIATILPSTAFFLGLPYAPARKMMENDICVAVASDYNPGTSPSGNMSFIISLACIKLKMTPSEAINAATINGAAAIELSQDLGSITIGKKANLIFLKKGSTLSRVPYQYGQSLVDKVVIKGIVF